MINVHHQIGMAMGWVLLVTAMGCANGPELKPDKDNCDCDACTAAATQPASTQPAAAEIHHARGRVVSVADGKSVTLDHEAMPDFMDAMQMTFTLQKGKDTEGLRPGDVIAFGLVKQPKGGFVVTHVKHLPADTALKLAGVEMHM